MGAEKRTVNQQSPAVRADGEKPMKTMELNITEPLRKGFVQLAGPYRKTERHMLEKAIAQLGAVPWQVLPSVDGIVLYRSTSGYKEVGEETI